MVIGAGAGIGAVGGLIGNLAVLGGAAGKGGERELEEAAQIWRDLELSNFDFTAIPPAKLRIVAEYMPQVYEALVPDEVKTISDSPELREAQIRGVQRMEQIGQEGLPLADKLAVDEISRGAAKEGERARMNALRTLGAKGQYSSADELMAALAGEQTAAESARSLGAGAIRESLARRPQAIAAAANMAGATRGQDADVQGRNAQIINAFNAMVANMRTQAGRDAAGSRERAGFANAGERQRIADTNTLGNVEAARRNQEYGNLLKGEEFGQRVQKNTGLTGALGNLSRGKYAEQAAKAQSLRSLGGSAGGGAGGLTDFLF